VSGSVRTPTAEDRAIPMQGNPLAETDRPYRLLVEAVVDYAIYLIDPSGRIATWNPGARRLKGYEAQEVIGQRPLRGSGPSGRARKCSPAYGLA
jgi:PAS domain-containing protein